MQKLLYLFLVINLSFLIGSCVDSVPFPTKSEDGFLSVEGTFHNLADTQFVKLYRSRGYTSTPNPEINARITVFSEDNKSANYNEIRPGVYAILPQILRGEVGKRYYIEIKTRDGKTYQSEPETMPEPIKPDSISFSAYYREVLSSIGFARKERTLRILISTPSKSINSDAFLRWNIKEAFDFISECSITGPYYTCYYSRNMPNANIRIASSKGLQLSYIDNLNINEVSLEAFSLQFKRIHYWQVIQNSISEKAYNYWEKTDKISNQVGSIFDTPPAYVPGNIYNVNDKDEKVLGYFEVAALEKIVRYLTIGEINRDYGSIRSKTESPCSDLYGPYNFDLCCFCPNYEISGWFNSPNKPSFWK
jgi:Domain of unknown function (DUF4249)